MINNRINFQDMELKLNYLPVSFNNNDIEGELLPYVDKDQLRSLQDEQKGLWICRRAGSKIQAIPLSDKAGTLQGVKASFNTKQDFQLFKRLLEEGVRRLLKSTPQDSSVSDFGKVVLRITGSKNDLLSQALQKRQDILKKIQFLKIYRCYEFDAVHVRVDAANEPEFGIRIKLYTKWEFGISVKELNNLGLDLRGFYTIPFSSVQHKQIGYKVMGSIREVKEGKVYLNDAREDETLDANEITVEGSLENVSLILKKLVGDGDSLTAIRMIRATISSFLGAREQQERIVKIATQTFQQPLHCANNLISTVVPNLQNTSQDSICKRLTTQPPSYLLRFGGSPIKGPIARGIDSQGPFDKESFKKTTPQVLIVTPKKWFGQVDQFIKSWRDGNLRSPYVKGFVKKYALRGCEIHFIDFDDSLVEVTKGYENACIQAIKESRDQIRRYDLAFVVISEKHRSLGLLDPYLACKAILMGSEIPVQSLEIETINSPVESWPFIMNNIALASYAKMGGTPWVLATPHGEGISHEIIMGIGSASVQESRLSEKSRYVGITTLFNYDGVYLLSKTSKEATYEEYPERLKITLSETLIDVSKRKGWQSGERVRLIVHSFKPLKDAEIEAVKDLVSNTLSKFKVDFAFLIISDHHNWMLYDPNNKGHEIRAGGGQYRGVQIPSRGNVVFLNEQEALLSITGPSEIKKEDHGTPSPLHIRLHYASTFRDIRYLTEQIFSFTYISWQTFNLISMPVTIMYSDMIARLLGRLRPVKNWNANILETSDLCNSLWFL